MTTPQFGPATGDARYSFEVPITSDDTFLREELPPEAKPNRKARVLVIDTVRLSYSQEYTGVGTHDESAAHWEIAATVSGPHVGSGGTEGVRPIDRTFRNDPRNEQNPYPDWPDWLVSMVRDYHPQKRQP